MRISDWSSDVCSSDLRQARPQDTHTGDAGVGVDGVGAAGGCGIAHHSPRAGHHPTCGDVRDPRSGRGLGQGATRARLRDHADGSPARRSEEHTYELQSLMRISYAVFCLTHKNNTTTYQYTTKHKTNSQ